MTKPVQLLRRAAMVLREHANAATAGPWAWEATSQQDNSWGLGGVVGADGDPLDGDVTDVPDTEVVDPVCYQDDGNLSDAGYITLMHPPVALALATWLDAAAEVVDANYECDGFDLNAIDDTCRGAVNTARALLRDQR